MCLKNFLWVLLGIAIGVGGLYFATRMSQSRVVKPDSPTNIAILFKEAVDDNSLYGVQELMTTQQEGKFTADNLKTVRQYVGVGAKAEAVASYDNYEVITFGTDKPVTLWLVPPNGNNYMWQIQKITEGATWTNVR